MACQLWADKLDAYLDGELPSAESLAIHKHMRDCAACASDSIDRLRAKRAVQMAGQRFTPDPAFRARMLQKYSSAPKRRSWRWLPSFAAPAFAVVLLVGVLGIHYNRVHTSETHLFSELADLHAATLASANPVDVVSTDRHTVKPWFAGKIPFTFNLPELAGTPFTLIGGRVSYLDQSPGAELIFKVRQHQISVFIFQEHAVGAISARDSPRTVLSFTVQSWSQNGLRFFAIGDTGTEDMEKLSGLLKSAT